MWEGLVMTLKHLFGTATGVSVEEVAELLKDYEPIDMESFMKFTQEIEFMAQDEGIGGGELMGLLSGVLPETEKVKMMEQTGI